MFWHFHVFCNYVISLIILLHSLHSDEYFDFEEYEFEIGGKRIYILRIKNCENQPLYFLGTEESKSTAYIREGQNNDLLQNFPDRLTYICSKKN